VLLLAVQADNRRLAVTLRLVRREQRHGDPTDLPADLLARLGQRAEVALEPAGIGIVDDGSDRDFAQRRIDGLPSLGCNLVAKRKRALDLYHHLPPRRWPPLRHATPAR